MFSTPPRGSPSRTSRAKQAEGMPEVSTILAAELATEYASLRAANNCPRGMYLTPSSETLLRWHGVFFVHRGPYAGYVLRFTLSFPTSFSLNPPSVRFDSDVFHPMIDPKSKLWHPRGQLAHWKPRIDHIPHLLHSVKSSFKSSALASISEDEAVNKQVWSLYQHSNQTFISLTSQRALQSTSKPILYPSDSSSDLTSQMSTISGRSIPASVPPSPTTPTRQRKISNDSFLSNYQDPGDIGPIKFKSLTEGVQEEIWQGLKASLCDRD